VRKRLLLAILGLGVAAIPALPSVSTAATIVNGGFETGTLAGWTVVDLSGGSGDWFVYTGTSSPLNGFAIAAPPEGTYAATTDQIAPGAYVLYQDVALEANFSHTLSFYAYYENQAQTFVTPTSLEFRVRNQQYRVDILKPTTPVTSLAPGDVLATAFRTNVGDPLTLAPTPVSIDLSSFRGTTVRIRFAEVSSLDNFPASVDKVAVTSTALPTTTEQCKNDGWRKFGTSFTNQGDCASFVATNGKNEPGQNQS
jgi:hypothetical protein